jgi:hypothetical protein
MHMGLVPVLVLGLSAILAMSALRKVTLRRLRKT